MVTNWSNEATISQIETETLVIGKRGDRVITEEGMPVKAKKPSTGA